MRCVCLSVRLFFGLFTYLSLSIVYICIFRFHLTTCASHLSRQRADVRTFRTDMYATKHCIDTCTTTKRIANHPTPPLDVCLCRPLFANDIAPYHPTPPYLSLARCERDNPVREREYVPIPPRSTTFLPHSVGVTGCAKVRYHPTGPL